MRPLVGLNVHEAAFRIAHGLEFLARDTAMGGTSGFGWHINSFRRWVVSGLSTWRTGIIELEYPQRSNESIRSISGFRLLIFL
jgi:hypothetical protein